MSGGAGHTPGSPPPRRSTGRPQKRWTRRSGSSSWTAEQLLKTATLQDIADEQRHRRHENYGQWAAIAVTAALSIGSIIAANAQTDAEKNIAALERARDRDEKRVACTEQYLHATTVLLNAGAEAAGPDAPAEAAIVLSAVDELGLMGVRCVAAGMVEGDDEAFGDALGQLTRVAMQPATEQQQAAILTMIEVLDGYVGTGGGSLSDIFETSTKSEE